MMPEIGKRGEECRDSGEDGNDSAYRNSAGDMQFFPWEHQSPHWHTSGP
jgi:hypothetical protein